MRTFEEIQADIKHATSVNDADALLRLAEELDGLSTQEATATALAARGVASHLRGNYPLALEHYHRALTLHEELGNRSGVATVTGNIGIVHVSTGNYPLALEHYHRAMALDEELGDRASVAQVTSNIGKVHDSTGNYPLALEHYHRALALHEELGDRVGVARVTGNIGIVHHSTGNYPLALEHYHRALAMHEELSNRASVALVTGNIGSVHHSTGNYPLALEHYHRALAVHEELGDRASVADVTGNIGAVHGSTGNYPLALEHFHRALAMHEELGNRAGVALVTASIGAALVTTEQFAEAEALLHTMESMQIDDPVVLIAREQLRAAIQEHNGEIDAALTTLFAALELAGQHTIAGSQAEIHKLLRDLALKQSDLASYVEHNNEFTRITEEINGKEATLKMAMHQKTRELESREKEHSKHMAVLHSTLPKHIADRVARGEVVSDHFENASVIFLDIVGFTSISDRIPSGHVVHLLEQIFTTLDAVCDKHNVVKVKTIGDSYMAVSFENVNNAAHCALEMIASLDALQITMPPSLGDTSWTQDVGEIQVRIGIHCGPITAGVIGTERMQYDVWGDTVNVASRMESTSEPGRIHVSEAFAQQLSLLGFERGGAKGAGVSLRGEIEVKGKGKMKTFWLESSS